MFINRVMHQINKTSKLNKNQFGFRPQTSTVDAIMTVKDFVEENLRNKNSVALISLDVQGAFDSAWWPSILNALIKFNCPKNLYNITKSYLSDRRCTLSANNLTVERDLSRGCPQGSCCGPSLWNIQYDSPLNLHYKPDTKVIAFADDVLVMIKGKSSLIIENKANVKIKKISNWAKNNKITFNTSKTQVMLVSRKKPKTAPKLSIHLNHGTIRQTWYAHRKKVQI